MNIRECGVVVDPEWTEAIWEFLIEFTKNKHPVEILSYVVFLAMATIATVKHNLQVQDSRRAGPVTETKLKQPPPNGDPTGKNGEPPAGDDNTIQFHTVSEEEFYSKDWKPSDSNDPAGKKPAAYNSNPSAQTLIQYSEGVMNASYFDDVTRERMKALWMFELEMETRQFLEEQGGFHDYLLDVARDSGEDEIIPRPDGSTCEIIAHFMNLAHDGVLQNTSWDHARALIADAAVKSGHCIEMLEEIGPLATYFKLPTSEGCICRLTPEQQEEQQTVFQRRKIEFEKEFEKEYLEESDVSSDDVSTREDEDEDDLTQIESDAGEDILADRIMGSASMSMSMFCDEDDDDDANDDDEDDDDDDDEEDHDDPRNFHPNAFP